MGVAIVLLLGVAMSIARWGMRRRAGGSRPELPESRGPTRRRRNVAVGVGGAALAALTLGLATPAVAADLATPAGAEASPATTVPVDSTVPVDTTDPDAAASDSEEAPAPSDADDLNYWVLLGVAVIVVGFLLKIDPIAVVIIAAAVTALVYDASFGDFLQLIGQSFVDNRSVSFFILTLPMIALSERFGLKEQAVHLIRRMRNVTAPRFLFLYTVIRQICGIFGIRISGMVQFVRPIVQPMSSAAAGEAGLGSDKNEELIKAEAAKAENIGNFFGQNGFVAASGVLLIVGTLEGLGYDVQPDEVVVASLPVIGVATIFAFVNSRLLAARLKAGADGASPAPTPEGGSDV